VHFIVKIIQYSYLGSISSTFYVQLLRLQIPKAQKDTDDLTVFFTLSGSTSVKAECKTLMKSTVDQPNTGAPRSI